MPQTGRSRIAERALQEIINQDNATVPLVVDDPSFTPVRVWTGGPGTPQEIIMVPGRPYGLRPENGGAYIARSQDMVDLLRRARGGQFWTDDIPADRKSMTCQECGWSTRSIDAYEHHTQQTHPKRQMYSN